MATKSSPFALYKPFIDAYMKGHPEVAKVLCNYNALAEWNQIKTNEVLIKSKIEKYLEVFKRTIPKSENDVQDSTVHQNNSLINGRKRTMSSDDEANIQDPLYDRFAVEPVKPTFSHRVNRKSTDPDEDPTKPWVVRGLEKAKARVGAHLAKIEARRAAKESRVKAPAQDALVKEIQDITERIANLIQVKNMGLSTEDTNCSLKKLIRQKKERSTELSLLRSKQRAGLRYRARRKKRLENLCSADPEVATELLKLYKASTISVHSIDNVSPDLLQTIEEIARIGGVSTTNSRFAEVYQPCTSLDDLRDRIKERGFEIRRSSLFYRLIPAGAFSEDGKKHVTSYSVRLRKLQNIEQVKHQDSYFVSATLKYIKDLAGTFGNDCVFYLTQDNKASIRIGRSAAAGHSPLIMRLDYQTSTEESTPIPSSVPFQLKPTVYASCIIDELGIVTNAGPTYIPIRSAKHDRTTIECEELDFDKVLKLKEFEKTARNHIGEVKPIIIMHVDLIDPKDYTRFSKTLHFSIEKFRKYNLDAFILVTQAPGQAAFGISERRLALISHDLSGLVLPHNYFGTHLNISGLTVDADVEKQNFKRTGEILAEVWNMNLIDRHQVVAEYIDPPASADEVIRFVDTQFILDCILDQICEEDEELSLHQRIQHSRAIIDPNTIVENKPKPNYPIDEYWCATHVFQSQYTIQIIRCTKPECCGPWRSNYIQVFPHRFLPPPVPFHRSSRGVRLADIQSSNAHLHTNSPYYGTLFQRIQFHGIVMEKTQNQLIPFDAYCPSVQEKLHSRMCTICKQYIPSPIRLRNHYRVHQQRYASKCIDSIAKDKKDEEILDDEHLTDPSDLPVPQVNISQNGVFLFTDMSEWLKPDFEEDPTVEPKQKSVAANAMAAIRKEKQLLAEANAAIADSALIVATSATAKTQNPPIESTATIAIDDILEANDIPEIKVEAEEVSQGIEQLTVLDKTISDSFDDLSDLIDQI